MQRVVGEEEIDRRSVPADPNLLVPFGEHAEPGVGGVRSQSGQNVEDASRLGCGEEDVDVDVVGRPDRSVVGERLGTAERMGDLRRGEGFLDRDDLLVVRDAIVDVVTGLREL